MGTREWRNAHRIRRCQPWQIQWTRHNTTLVDCFERMRGSGENTPEPDQYSRTPLHRVAENWYVGAVGALLGRNDVNLNMPSQSGETLLHIAATNWYNGVVKMLLGRNDVNPGKPDRNYCTKPRSEPTYPPGASLPPFPFSLLPFYRFTGPTSPTFFSLITIDYVFFYHATYSSTRIACLFPAMDGAHASLDQEGPEKIPASPLAPPSSEQGTPNTSQRLDYQQCSNWGEYYHDFIDGSHNQWWSSPPLNTNFVSLIKLFHSST